jgi:hypothetical protein
MSRVYIAGPMRGYPHFNFPAFDAARDAWAARGWEVVSPADMDRSLDGLDETAPTQETNHSFAHYMRRDISALLRVDAIAFLPGWEASTGANVEKVVAQALNLDLYDAITFAALELAENRNGTPSMFPVLEKKLELCCEVPAHHTI